MTTFLKIVLAVSATFFLASLTEAGSAIAWGFLKPLSAILFIVFFIGQLLHKEVVKYDEEDCARMALAKAPSASPSATRPLRSAQQESRNNAPLVAVH
jgi:hypothetical protein